MKIKTVSICGKTADLCHVQLIDEQGNVVKENNGYVPAFMPGEHYGDYIILDINVKTGKITNWTQKNAAAVQRFVEEKG